MAAILIIIDGMTDTPQPELGDRTPVQTAQSPAFKRLGQEGERGTFSTCPPGYPVDSLSCILTLLGYPPENIPSGRSALEALAAGISLTPEDAVLRGNLVLFDGKGGLLSSCGGNLEAGQREELCRQMAKKLSTGRVEVVPMGSYKNLLVLRGHRDNLPGLRTFPPHEHGGESFSQLLPKGNLLAGELTALVQNSILPAPGGGFYGLLPWGEASCSEIPSFSQLQGCRGAVVCATEIVRGIGLAAGMETPRIPGTTADVDTDLAAKREKALELLGQYDLVLLHLNGADEASHRRNPREKTEFLEKIDQDLLTPLLEQVPNGTRILLTSDHATLSHTGEHKDIPQPFFLWEKGKNLQKDWGNLCGRSAVRLLLDQNEKERTQPWPKG